MREIEVHNMCSADCLIYSDEIVNYGPPESKSPEGGGPFSDPWQRRRSRGKIKVPFPKRVAERRRRKLLAKKHKKYMKLVASHKGKDG